MPGDLPYTTLLVQELETFLARPRIYLTERMFAYGEEHARANLRRELASLG